MTDLAIRLGFLVAFFGLFPLAGGGLFWLMTLQSTRLWRRLRATPASCIAGAAGMDSVRIQGVVQPGETQPSLAPFSQRPAVYARIAIEEIYFNGRTRTCRPLLDRTWCAPFVVEDPTGRAWVDPTQARVVVRRDIEAICEPGGPTRRWLQETLAYYGAPQPDPTGTGRVWKFWEEVIGPGETIQVAGQPVRRPASGAAASPMTTVCLQAGAGELVLSTLPEAELMRQLGGTGKAALIVLVAGVVMVVGGLASLVGGVVAAVFLR
jgi:hypothetical protein